MYGKTFHVKRKKQFTFCKFPFHLVFFYSAYDARRGDPRRQTACYWNPKMWPGSQAGSQAGRQPTIVLFYLGKHNSCSLLCSVVLFWFRFCLAQHKGLSSIFRVQGIVIIKENCSQDVTRTQFCGRWRWRRSTMDPKTAAGRPWQAIADQSVGHFSIILHTYIPWICHVHIHSSASIGKINRKRYSNNSKKIT